MQILLQKLSVLALSSLLTVQLLGCGGSSGSDNEPPVNPPPINLSPQANAGANQNVVEGTSVTLNASGSSDSDGEIASYLWEQTVGPTVELTGNQTAQAVFLAPAVDATTNFGFRLTVTDDDGATATDEVAINVRDENTPAEVGLDARPVNSSCIAPEPPATSASIELTRVFGNLSFSASVGLLHEPGNDSRWYVIEQAGRIRVFENSASATVRTFIDMQDLVDDGPGEAGLLAMAFHPNFADNGEVFLYYIREQGNPRSRNTLARFTSRDGGQTLDKSSEEILISIEHPYDNHYGGQLGFDRAGMLYLSIGDGGSGGDPGNRAQNTRNLFGTMLRIDVDAGEPYAIPTDNPYAGNALCTNGSNAADTSCPEIFAWGLRNPWRWSFDRATGDIWLADVGQNRVEEVNRIQLGGNYGWRIREGNQCHNPQTNCSTAGLIDPVAVIPQPTAQSITGGFVYRGSNIPALAGQYIVGDFVTGGLWVLEADGDGTFSPELLDNTGKNIASFAEDMAGELYLVTHNGEIHRIDPVGTSSDNFPRLLSQTGCVDSSNPAVPAPGLIPYGVNAPFWSDGADKQRWLALPEASTIDINNTQDWELPLGSVLMKHFHLQEQLIETRLFMRHNNGDWAGYSYEWNDDGTDANLVQGGKVTTINGQQWIYPSSAECLQCHTAAAGRSLGVETAQLNGDFTYDSTGRTANQLITHDTIGTLTQPLADTPENLPRLAAPSDSSAGLTERARAYLHTNCSNCHRPGGPTNVNLDLRHTVSVAAMNICNVVPQNGALGIANAQLLAPGAPQRSILLQRMSRRDAVGMPPLGSKAVDAAGVALIEDWIESLNACP